MIEHYIELGPARTGELTESIVLQINGLGALARKRPLRDEERDELMALTGDWEMAQIARLAFVEAEALLIHCRLQGLST